MPMLTGRPVDCHAHIIDPVRLPFPDGRGYRPRSHETGTREDYGRVLDRNGVGHALLVQPSGYGFDNAAMLDAIAHGGVGFKGIAMVAPAASERALEDLAAAGVVGVRFNLVSHDPRALERDGSRQLLERLRTLGWFAQVFADDTQWAAVAVVLRESGIGVLVDNFGVRDVAAGIDQPGYQAVLLGRDSRATVKLSAAFRIVRTPDETPLLDPFAEALLAAFWPERCIWGSDWPFLGIAPTPQYAASQRLLERWLSDPLDRERVLWRNAARLFQFGG